MDRLQGNPGGEPEQAGGTSPTSMCWIPQEELKELADEKSYMAALQHAPSCHCDDERDKDGWKVNSPTNSGRLRLMLFFIFI